MLSFLLWRSVRTKTFNYVHTTINTSSNCDACTVCCYCLSKFDVSFLQSFSLTISVKMYTRFLFPLHVERVARHSVIKPLSSDHRPEYSRRNGTGMLWEVIHSLYFPDDSLGNDIARGLTGIQTLRQGNFVVVLMTGTSVGIAESSPTDSDCGRKTSSL